MPPQVIFEHGAQPLSIRWTENKMPRDIIRQFEHYSPIILPF